MMITERSKSVIPFRPGDAKRVGEGCFYLDLIVWLNGDHVEMGDRVGFNYGCYVNGYGGLRIGDRTIVGPYVMIHTANHEMAPERPIVDQGWTTREVRVGSDCWIGMGVSILPGVTIGEPRSVSWLAVWTIVYGPKIARSPMTRPPKPLT